MAHLSMVRDELLPEVEEWREHLEAVKPTSAELLSRVLALQSSAQGLYQSMQNGDNTETTAQQQEDFDRLMAERDNLKAEVLAFLNLGVSSDTIG